MKLLILVLLGIGPAFLPLAHSEELGAQRISIPQLMPERGVIPSFKILVEGEEIGRLRGDAVLSSGRFFGIRWIADPKNGWRAEVKDGDPNTLHVWAGGGVRLERE